MLTPAITPGTYRVESETERPAEPFELPFIYHIDQTTLFLNLQIENSFFYPTHYEFFADDCVDSIWINGISYNQVEPLFCDYQFGRTFDLAQLLRPGVNEIQVRIRNWGGRGDFNLHVSRQDPQSLMIRFLFVAVCLCYGIFLIRKYRGSSPYYWIYLVLLGGAALRLIYVVATPFGVRSHDVVGHIEYIKFVDELHAIPHFQTSWTFHHPPLYYFVSALWLNLGRLLSFSNGGLFTFIQFESLLCSIITLAIGCWIAVLAFGEREQRYERLICSGVFATFPGLVFFSARINNDALFQVFAFLIVALLIYWWQKPNLRSWLLLSAVLGLGLLVKATTLLLSAWVFLLFLLRAQGNIRERAQALLASLLVILAISGWFFYLRYVVQGQHSIDPTFATSHKSLIVENTLANFLVFNPIKILEFAYNNPWSDLERRMFFWEYLYRSAFLGEFIFGRHLLWIASYLLLLGFHLIPLLVYGLVREPYRRDSLGVPLGLLLFASIGALISLRLEYPAASAQDFRFIFYALIPVAYFLTRAIQQVRSSQLRIVASTFLASLAGASALFVLLLYWYRTPNKFELDNLDEYHSWKRPEESSAAASGEYESSLARIVKRWRNISIKEDSRFSVGTKFHSMT